MKQCNNLRKIGSINKTNLPDSVFQKIDVLIAEKAWTGVI